MQRSQHKNYLNYVEIFWFFIWSRNSKKAKNLVLNHNLEFLQMDSLNAIWHILHISTHTQQLKQAGPKPSPGRAGFFEVSCLGYSLNQIDPQNPQDAQNRYQAFFFLLLFGEIFSQKAQLYYNITYICVCVLYVLTILNWFPFLW